MKTPDEIKKGLRHCSEDGCKGCPYKEDCDMADGFSVLAYDALAYIQQLDDHIRDLTKMMPKWISVEERLPEDGQRVVGIAENGMTGIMDYRDDGTPFAARIFGVYFSNITHWMHLPCAPKEEA